MTIEQPVILNVGPEEFSVGLTYTGSSRTREFTNLAFDPMPSYNRILKIFSRPTFKEKEAEVKRRDRDIISREAEAGAALLEGEEVDFPCDFVYRKIHIIFPTSGAFRNIAK